MPGMRRREYTSNDQMRNAPEETHSTSNDYKDGSHVMGAPNWLDDSEPIPTEAMSERCMEPRVRTGASTARSMRDRIRREIC